MVLIHSIRWRTPQGKREINNQSYAGAVLAPPSLSTCHLFTNSQSIGALPTKSSCHYSRIISCAKDWFARVNRATPWFLVWSITGIHWALS